MLIMTLAYAQRADDIDYLTKHYNILKQWTGFLVEEALVPDNQVSQLSGRVPHAADRLHTKISTDDFAGSAANQTNLALKGIIAIEAMAQIASLTGDVEDSNHFSAVAHDYITQWQSLGVNDNAELPHTTFTYGNSSSSSLLYNLFADRELGLGLVPQEVYDMQSEFYPTQLQKYGVPLDTRHGYTKNDWEVEHPPHESASCHPGH
jgi:hypothetical protein